MAVFKIFPEKDAFITTEFSTANTGIDEILELGAFPSISGQGQSSRILLNFTDTEIQKVFEAVGDKTYQTFIRLFLADTYEIPTTYTVTAAPIYLPEEQQWEQGTGKYGDVPVNTSGVSWEYINSLSAGVRWPTNLPQGVTSSYDTAQGGGTWYKDEFEGSQLHTINSNHDLKIDVTPSISAILDGTISNKGYIIKLENSLDFNTGTPLRFKYFSKDTNTIYPPVLEIHWDDSEYDSTLSELTTDLATIKVINGKQTYKVGTKQRLNIAAKPKYPQRQFSTGSIYSTNFKLPEDSYWGLKDEYTEEMVIDFNPLGTKLSADNVNSYFTLYTEGLQPERYYKILIKTTIAGSDLIIPIEEPFKVVRNA